jgi:hypothetical protein
MNRSTTNTFLKFRDESGEIKLVSIDSILISGYPISAETGEDLELVSDLCDENGDPV